MIQKIVLRKDGIEKEYWYFPETMQLTPALIGLEYFIEQGWDYEVKDDDIRGL